MRSIDALMNFIDADNIHANILIIEDEQIVPVLSKYLPKASIKRITLSAIKNCKYECDDNSYDYIITGNALKNEKNISDILYQLHFKLKLDGALLSYIDNQCYWRDLHTYGLMLGSVKYRNILVSETESDYCVKAMLFKSEIIELKKLYTSDIRKKLSTILHRLEYDIEPEDSTVALALLCQEHNISEDYLDKFIRNTVQNTDNLYNNILGKTIPNDTYVTRVKDVLGKQYPSDKTIAFISCVNNEEMYAEATVYLYNLIVPEGYGVEIIAIRNAKSMCTGYNSAMRQTNAKYKVYLHQDCFIGNSNYIQDVLNIFSDKTIGCIGVIGAADLLDDCRWWNSPKKYGRIIQNVYPEEISSTNYPIEAAVQDVVAVDGLIIATQYDIKWREDLFMGWHFYDLSICNEFIKKGYRVVVPHQDSAWCIHCPSDKLLDDSYDKYRLVYQKYIRGQEIGVTVQESAAEAKKIKVLFLPYKASMWDSLESVWIAAKSDSRCEATVVVIPYYDRNPDRSLSEYHYEANQMPEYINVVDFNEYDIEAEKPDVIYIHNPYDEMNLVTSVDPKYYSDRLNKYTNMLVYIPYYYPGLMDGEIIYMMPGIKNADRVIANNDVIKYQYSKYISKDKILTLGTPKLDKVINARRIDFTIPYEWRKMLKNKKAILYNLHLTLPLTYAEVFIKKIRYMFAKFSKRKDVVVWLRPHPLMEATIKSMSVKLLDDYREIIKKFIDEKVGIYDDTPDLHRAIACTDAYYGDGYSLLNMYMETGKDCVRQDMFNNFDCDVNNIAIWSNAFCMSDEDTVWFVHGKMNMLFKYSRKNDKATAITYVPGEQSFQELLYCDIEYFDKKIFLIPHYATYVMVYNIITSTFTKLEIPLQELYSLNITFCKVIRFNTNLYCIPYGYPYIIKVDMINDIAEPVCDIMENTYKCIGIKDFFIADCCKLKDEAVIGIYNKTNIAFVYNIKTGGFGCKKVGENNGIYNSVACTEKYIIFAGTNIIWCDINNVDRILNKEKITIRVRNVNDKYFLLDNIESECWMISDNNLSVVLRDNGVDSCNNMPMSSDKYDVYIRNENGILYGFNCYANTLYFYDANKRDFINIIVKCDNLTEKVNELLANCVGSKKEIPGIDLFSMYDYNKSTVEKKSNIGKLIHEEIVKNITV